MKNINFLILNQTLIEAKQFHIRFSPLQIILQDIKKVQKVHIYQNLVQNIFQARKSQGLNLDKRNAGPQPPTAT